MSTTTIETLKNNNNKNILVYTAHLYYHDTESEWISYLGGFYRLLQGASHTSDYS